MLNNIETGQDISTRKSVYSRTKKKKKHRRSENMSKLIVNVRWLPFRVVHRERYV